MTAWGEAEADKRPDLLRLGYFGSYARGDWGVGSDLDIVAVVAASPLPFERRGVDWGLDSLPVPAEILVYTAQEWDALRRGQTRFARTLETECIWLDLPPRPPRSAP